MTTNYFNTLIEIAPDSPTDHAIAPDLAKSTVASQQYAMIANYPYQYTSDDVLFARVAEKDGLAPADVAEAQAAYFRTGRACMRASPLPKTHGWGIHADAQGRIALIPVESEVYLELQNDPAVTKLKAMRRSRG